MDRNDEDLDCGWEIENPEHSIIFEKAKPLLKTRSNALHTRISYHFAITLLEKVGGDPKIVIPAILLHDIGWSIIPESQHAEAFGPYVKKPELQRLHETEGARMAGEILTDLEYSGHQIHEIEEIISGHDTRSDSLNSNDSIVKDADKLWRYSYEGFTTDYKRFEKTPRDCLIWLIESISKWFFTEVAKILAHKEVLQRKANYGIELD